MGLVTKIKGIFVAAVVAGTISFGPSAFAQNAAPQQPNNQQQGTENISEADLKKFVNANQRAISVQRESEQAMMAVIQEERLSIDKFNEIAQAQHEQDIEQADATPEEIAAFNRAAHKIVEMQEDIQQQMVNAIEQEGLTIQQFEMIMMAYQHDKTVQAKVQAMLED
jgi:hypothetical protein